MDSSTVEQYFELAMDLPERKRAKLLAKLDAEEPEIGQAVRDLLSGMVNNDYFACTSGVVGQPRAVDTVHHVAIQVQEIAAAVVWYRDQFGCRVEYEDASWAMLRFGNVSLALVLPGQHPPHFALARPDAARFGKLNEHRDGSKSTYVKDPWGNVIEVLDQDSL